MSKLQEQLICLVTRGTKIDHEPNGRDDYANAAAGVVWRIRLAQAQAQDVVLAAPGLYSGDETLSEPRVLKPSTAPAEQPAPSPHRFDPPAHYLKSGQPREPWWPYVDSGGDMTWSSFRVMRASDWTNRN
jgi:hypothetical protein